MAASFLSYLRIDRSVKSSNNTEVPAVGSVLGSLKTAQVEPPRTLTSAMGRRFYGGTQVIANGIAPVSAIPTTTATLALFNGEYDGGASLVVERVGFCLGSGTAAAGATLFVCVTSTKVATVPTMASNYAVQSMSDGSRASRAILGTAVTVATSGWFAAASSFQLAAANVGQGGDFYIADGEIVVPPGYAMGLAILSGAGTSPLYSVSCVWSELDLDLE